MANSVIWLVLIKPKQILIKSFSDIFSVVCFNYTCLFFALLIETVKDREFQHYFNRRNFREKNFRDSRISAIFASLSREIVIHLRFAKVYLAKFREIPYSLKFDLNFVLFSAKTSLCATTLHSLTKVYTAKFLESHFSRKLISEILWFFVIISKLSLPKVYND